ncbi:hypothetical protein [Skermania sp. ID1734]|nr:hypothetical protein [Skermania sp. ID1734]
MTVIQYHGPAHFSGAAGKHGVINMVDHRDVDGYRRRSCRGVNLP